MVLKRESEAISPKLFLCRVGCLWDAIGVEHAPVALPERYLYRSVSSVREKAEEQSVFHQLASLACGIVPEDEGRVPRTRVAESFLARVYEGVRRGDEVPLELSTQSLIQAG